MGALLALEGPHALKSSPGRDANAAGRRRPRPGSRRRPPLRPPPPGEAGCEGGGPPAPWARWRARRARSGAPPPPRSPRALPPRAQQQEHELAQNEARGRPRGSGDRHQQGGEERGQEDPHHGQPRQPARALRGDQGVGEERVQEQRHDTEAQDGEGSGGGCVGPAVEPHREGGRHERQAHTSRSGGEGHERRGAPSHRDVRPLVGIDSAADPQGLSCEGRHRSRQHRVRHEVQDLHDLQGRDEIADLLLAAPTRSSPAPPRVGSAGQGHR